MKKFNMDLNVLNELLLAKSYKHLGNILLDNEDIFTDMTEVMDFINHFNNGEKVNRSSFSMIEVHKINKSPKCPKLIKEVTEYIKNFNPYNKRLNVIGIVGFENATGYRWHYDDYHVIAMNIIGETIWYFKDGNKIKMKPGDLLFVPSPIEHQVEGTGERFTLAFCSLTNKKILENKK
jgi:quercetin dioxygenase-like cupin family protein